MKLLFVCTRNLARSPIAEKLCRDFPVECGRDRSPASRLQVRSAGIDATAARRLTTRDVAWADVIVAMEEVHLEHVRHHWPDHAHKVRVLGVPDLYAPDEAELREVLLPKIQALLDDLARG